MKSKSMIRMVAAFCLALALSTVAQSQARKSLRDEVSQSEKAARVFREIMDAPDKGIPQGLLDGAECVAVFPSAPKAGFIFGGRGGRGVASCRAAAGWMMKVMLEMWNYEVSLAGAADDGLHLAQSEHFDLYLLDTHLPDESGFEMCKRICGVSGHAPVVFTSTAPYEADKQRGRQAGAIAYFTKPLDFDVLEITLTRLITQSLGRGLENTLCVPLSNGESVGL